MTDEQLLDQWHLATLFATKVFEECRKAGVTPRTATGDEIHLPSVLDRAEHELGLSIPILNLELMNRWQRYEVEWENLRRRRYCYNLLLRITSGGIII